MPMHIFDDIKRTYQGPAENAEGQFAYLNRSALPEWAKVRAVMENWFAEYPPEHRNDLVSRIRDDSDAQHNSAYFELFLYTVFSRFGFSITIHPDSPTGKGNPDFLMKSEEIPPFYLEAKVVTGESEQSIRHRRFWEEIQDFINQEKSVDFFLRVHLLSNPSTQPPLKKIRTAVRNYIDSANRDEKWFDIHGWKYVISLIPKPDRSSLGDRLVAVSSYGFQPVINKDFQDIQSAIEDKAGKYGQFLSPYVIAINMLNPWAGFSDFISALFGEHDEAFSRGDGTLPGLTFRSSSAALHWHGEPQNTRVSAVIAFRHALPWHIPGLYVCPNPWAQYPLPQPLPRLSRFDLTDDRFAPVAGDPLKEILGLPPNWPNE